jgi:phage-related protein
MGTSLEAVRKFPSLARQRAGFQLGRVQQGLEPRDWKPLPSVGAGVKEIRIHTENEYRVFYTAAFQNNVYVLHAFDKKTRKTSRADIGLGKARYRDVPRQEAAKK